MPGLVSTGMVAVSGVQLPVRENLSHYITSQLSLAIPPCYNECQSKGGDGLRLGSKDGYGLRAGGR